MLPLLVAGTIGLIGALSYAFKPYILPKLLEATAWPADPAIGKIPQAESPEELKPHYENKRVLVVGGTRGVGFAVAQACSRAGAHVTIVGRSPQSAQHALKTLGDNASFIQGDIGAVSNAKETM
jgi:NADPH:quinone reductase-like Zn-dependent oxidoreductase